jgi:PAS domain S-box-containing protein
VSQHLTDYKLGIQQISALMVRRAELLSALPKARDHFEAIVSDVPDTAVVRDLFRAQNQVAEALLARNSDAATQAAQHMRTIAVQDTAVQTAVAGYVDSITAISDTEHQISRLDSDVLYTESSQIGGVTNLLRDLSAIRSRILSNDLSRIISDDKWQTIILGVLGILVGLGAAMIVVQKTVSPLKSIARAIRLLAGGEKDTSIPGTETSNEIGDIARAAEVFRRTLLDADTAREAAVHALSEQRLAEESYRKLFEGSVDGIYVTTPAGSLLNANPALARIMGYQTPEELMKAIGDVAYTVYVNPRSRDEYQTLMHRDGTVREFEYQVRQRGGEILWLSDSATAVHDDTGQVVRYEGTVRGITDQKRAEDANGVTP